jgi:hypothetical protein
MIYRIHHLPRKARIFYSTLDKKFKSITIPHCTKYNLNIVLKNCEFKFLNIDGKYSENSENSINIVNSVVDILNIKNSNINIINSVIKEDCSTSVQLYSCPRVSIQNSIVKNKDYDKNPSLIIKNCGSVFIIDSLLKSKEDFCIEINNSEGLFNGIMFYGKKWN